MCTRNSPYSWVNFPISLCSYFHLLFSFPHFCSNHPVLQLPLPHNPTHYLLQRPFFLALFFSLTLSAAFFPTVTFVATFLVFLAFAFFFPLFSFTFSPSAFAFPFWSHSLQFLLQSPFSVKQIFLWTFYLLLSAFLFYFCHRFSLLLSPLHFYHLLYNDLYPMPHMHQDDGSQHQNFPTYQVFWL